MKDYTFLFVDEDDGYFMVETRAKERKYAKMEAESIARTNFAKPEFIREVSFAEAEMLGYDTY